MFEEAEYSSNTLSISTEYRETIGYSHLINDEGVLYLKISFDRSQFIFSMRLFCVFK